MKKKLIAVFCILILALQAAGCKSQDGKEPAEDFVEPAQTPDAEGEEIDRDAVVLKIGTVTATYEELLLYFRSYKQKTEELYGPDIWEYVLRDDGLTYEEHLKEKILEELKYIKIICAQAERLDAALGEDERRDVEEYTADYMERFTQEDLIQYGFTEETVRKIYAENLLTNKIYELLTLNVDTDVEDEEVRHAVFYYIFLAKTHVDAEGKKTAYTQEELEALKLYAQEVYERAGTEDFYELAMACSDDEDEIEFTTGRQEMRFEFAEEAFLLQEGEMTGLLQNDAGYFIFYCKDEMDEALTEEAKIRLILERQQTAFDDSYAKWEAETEVELNEKIWEKIRF